jgi:UDP-N-acetylglucosamine--dolichyl-phosphate N-acetylglucosaminephosphotransferase
MGFIDDIFGWKIGLSKRMRMLFILISAIPLSVINAGDSTMIGINFGIFYPLLIVPLAVLCCSVAFNTIAGYNGLETRQAIILLSALLLVNYSIGERWLSFIILIMISSLVAFYIFNKNPAKVFPGNVLTYALGAFIAIIAILGNIEKIAVFFFIPYIIEVILKLKGKLERESYARLNEDGSLEMPYEKVYGLEHLSILILKKIKPNKKVYEEDVVLLINIFQIIIIILGFLIFKIPLKFS